MRSLSKTDAGPELSRSSVVQSGEENPRVAVFPTFKASSQWSCRVLRFRDLGFRGLGI